MEEKGRRNGKGKQTGKAKAKGKGKGKATAKATAKDTSEEEVEEVPAPAKTKQRKPAVPTGEIHDTPCEKCRRMRRVCEKEASNRACVSCKNGKHRCDYAVPGGRKNSDDEDGGVPAPKRRAPAPKTPAVKVGPPGFQKATPAEELTIPPPRFVPTAFVGPAASPMSQNRGGSAAEDAIDVDAATASRPRPKPKKRAAAPAPGMPPFCIILLALNFIFNFISSFGAEDYGSRKPY